jgi:hypothetical protein
MAALRAQLGIVVAHQPEPTAETASLEPETPEEHALKSTILEKWQQHQHLEKELAPLLYQLCVLLHAPGRKGQGFEAWLKQNRKSKATAYRCIKRYAKREGLPLPYKEKGTRLGKAEVATSSHVIRPSLTIARSDGHDLQAAYIPAPASTAEMTGILQRYFDRLQGADQYQECMALIAWIETNILHNRTSESILEVANA